MGYRANVVTQHREYGSQTFANWSDFMYGFVADVEKKEFEISYDESEDFFEIEVGQLEGYMLGIPDNEEPSVYKEYTNKELKEELQRAIDESKGAYVSWEWF